MLRIRDLKEEQTTWTRKCCSDGFANKARLIWSYIQYCENGCFKMKWKGWRYINTWKGVHWKKRKAIFSMIILIAQ